MRSGRMNCFISKDISNHHTDRFSLEETELSLQILSCLFSFKPILSSTSQSNGLQMGPQKPPVWYGNHMQPMTRVESGGS